MGKNQRKKISEKYLEECVIFHTPLDDALARVEVTSPGLIGICNGNDYEVCEPISLYSGKETEALLLNAKTIKVVSEMAQELGMTLFYRPSLGLSDINEGIRAVEGEHCLQRRDRKARERVVKWKGRTHGDVTHISMANREED